MVATTIPKELIKKIKIWRKKGLSYSKLSLKFGISKDRIMYLLSEKYRENTKRLSHETYLRNKDKLTSKRLEERRKFQREYQNKRYHNDPSFREKHLQRVKKNQENKL